MSALPYSFTDISGPGCGQDAHADDCLCDVVITKPIQTNTSWQRSGVWKMADKMQPRLETAEDLYRWAAYLLGGLEICNAVKIDPSEYKSAQAAGDGQAASVGGPNRWRGRYVIQALLGQGFSIQTCARYLGIETIEVVRTLSKCNKTTAKQVLDAEFMLGEGFSKEEIVRVTGVGRYVLKNLAVSKGMQTGSCHNKIDRSKIVKIVELRKRKCTWRKIQVETGVAPATAQRIYKRELVTA